MLLELSYPLSPDIPVYPGSPVEDFRWTNRISKGDACNTTVITHYLHSGTHVDAPFHFDAAGDTIDRLPLESFQFSQALLIDCRLPKSGLISVEHIMGASISSETELLLFHTGYAVKRAAAEIYCDDFPSLSLEAAEYIRRSLPTVRAVAIDTLSIESAVHGPQKDFPVHKALLSSRFSPEPPVLVFEDVNTALLLGKRVEGITAYPLRLVGLDASPVAMVAEVRA